VADFFHRRARLLWACHSLYALALGIGFMWLGARNYTYLRVAVFHILFIWATSFLLPVVRERIAPTSPWRTRVQLVVNYFNKNFYQQVLFFILPIYYFSTTLWSRNGWFLALLALSALLSTMDLVYDRHLSVRRVLAAGFFAFNLFAWINVALPVVWAVSNAMALRASVPCALLAFATIALQPHDLTVRRTWAVMGLATVILLGILEFGRPFIPPAPLRLVEVQFGTGLQRGSLELARPLGELPADWSGPLLAVAAIQAPLGLQERVGLRWYEDDRLVYASSYHLVTGGRKAGYRLWTSVTVHPSHARRLRLEVETEGGQLIGRAHLDVASVPAPRL
jgi:hypothetical protein